MERYYILGIQRLHTARIIHCCKQYSDGGFCGYFTDSFIVRDDVFKHSFDPPSIADDFLNNPSAYIGTAFEVLLNEMEDEIFAIHIPTEECSL